VSLTDAPVLRRRLDGAALMLPGLAALVVVAALAHAALGAVKVPPLHVLAVAADLAGIDLGVPVEAREHAIVAALRLPRTALALLVGAALGIGGALMQGLFRNPLADPGLVGISSGAALGAVAVIVLGHGIGGAWTLTGTAFALALLVTLAVRRAAISDGETSVATMLLAGIAVNALASALTGLLITMSDDRQLRDIVFWTMGSLGGAGWPTVAAILPFVAAALILGPMLAPALDAFVLGERVAGHLGVDAERVKRRVVLLVAATVGASVAMCGVIGFVGLVVPHLVRLLGGPMHRRVLPGAALLGAALLTLADLAARTLAAPAELPIGLVTSAIGAPFFLALLLKQRRAGNLA
jgi:iron complex transport system permease protein